MIINTGFSETLIINRLHGLDDLHVDIVLACHVDEYQSLNRKIYVIYIKKSNKYAITRVRALLASKAKGADQTVTYLKAMFSNEWAEVFIR